MTALTPADKERQKTARARAVRIRDGITNYLHTLGDIAEAWNQGDWRTLGYETWGAYVDGEFGADRLRLPAAHRQKAITELRLTTDMSNRAIAKVVNADPRSIRRDISSGEAPAPPEGEVRGSDGKTYATKSPLVEAITEALEDVERTQTPADRQSRADQPVVADPGKATEGVAGQAPPPPPPPPRRSRSSCPIPRTSRPTSTRRPPSGTARPRRSATRRRTATSSARHSHARTTS